MTLEELFLVRSLKDKIAVYERTLKSLRSMELLKISKYNELPKSKSAISRVEKIAIRCADIEKKIDVMKNKLIEVTAELERKICAEFTDLTEQTILIFRYVYCMFFRDISNAMGYSEKHIYFLHKRIIEKLKG